MRYTSAQLGRTLVLRLEDGDMVHECVERVARAEGISHGVAVPVGGADDGSRVVVGPEQGRAAATIPMERALAGVHEAAGVGTIFPDADGRPVLHMHAVFGRGNAVVAGCIRRGVQTWVIGEVVVIELTGCSASRRLDTLRGFELLDMGA